jgi:hypothetical protein
MVTAQSPTQPSYIISPDVSSAGFNLVCESFEVARRTCPDEYVESYYSLAGKGVCMRIVGRCLAATYRRAFAPLAQSAGSLPFSLTIDLWDESVTGIPYPLSLNSGAESQQQTPEGEWQSISEGGRWVWTEKADMASCLDQKVKRLVGWRARGEKLAKHERSKPFASILPWWLYHQGIDILHACTVARNGNGLLITGRSGIGKSTTTLSCMQAGFDCLGDDYIAVTPHEGGAGSFIAHSIYQSVRFYADELYRFPTLHPYTLANEEPDDPKALVFLAEAYPGHLLSQTKISAIVLARRIDQPQTRFQGATRGETFKYVWGNSLVTPLGVGRTRFEHITQFVSSAPAYWLDLGHDLDLVPSVIAQLIQEIS